MIPRPMSHPSEAPRVRLTPNGVVPAAVTVRLYLASLEARGAVVLSVPDAPLYLSRAEVPCA